VQRARKLVETRLLCILALTKHVHSAHGSWWRRGSSIHASLLLALLLLHSQLYYCTACTEAGGDEAPQFIPAYMHAHDILAHYADVIRTAGTEAGGDEAAQSMPAYMHILCHTHAYADLLCVCYVIRAAGTEAGGDEAAQSIPAYLDTRRAACFNRWHDRPPGSVCC
jgi:hypothetical protein